MSRNSAILMIFVKVASFGFISYTCADMVKIAIIETGGKQYVVTNDTVLKVEKLDGEHKQGDSIIFDKVLLTDDGSKTSVGTPYITGATVSATFVEDARHKTVRVIRYREKSRSFKKRGHRQPYTQVRINSL